MQLTILSAADKLEPQIFFSPKENEIAKTRKQGQIKKKKILSSSPILKERQREEEMNKITNVIL